MIRIKYPLLLSALLAVQLAGAQSAPSADASKAARMKWWREARFGMFIHWGVYAQWGGVYHGHNQARGGAEWIMNRSKIPVAEYKERAKSFNPDKYDPDLWVKLAKDAGMKYIIITAKHHDGFALFNSKASDWDITDATAYGKDLLKPLAEACKKYGVKLGFYYSQAQDWGNAGGSVARKEMREGWPNPDSAKVDAYTKEHNGHWDPIQETKSFAQYIDDVAVPQVKELMTNYGEIAVLWWDTPTNMTDEAALKLQEQLKLQPQIITNDRLKRPNFPGDTKTPEQKIPTIAELDGKDWETCMTMNGSWGYKSWDNNWKSSETLVRNLIDIASKGGNYLLNIGPGDDGSLPQESIHRLQQIAAWMNRNQEAIHATKASPIAPLSWGRVTRKENGKNTTLYISVFDWPKDGKLNIPGIKNKIKSVTLLGADRLTSSKKGDLLTITVPGTAPDPIATVIKLELKGKMVNVNTAANEKMKSGELD
ncbi:alpha-L-fucosidase [Pseudobacter ginsenosidimutans]|uniref:alpha-L-fucosidase n=1 Tax=Pseudobacter ginsenosidimutans TaxID=661488 RepID=A0A4Q7MZ80_9BACT|nr:alpha-L-fucosidase [Pseudobacter ginsenosidimutans]QEC43207.1 alpha-L-fucosidase [Pseudobacter ginsenosidimutans]RZS74567.1 alpha-L-fucosidase [Pseudobacter ginsenosidimutans]